MLEEEIYGENSPIWEADFTMPASDGTQLGHQTGEGGCVPWYDHVQILKSLLRLIDSSTVKVQTILFV